MSPCFPRFIAAIVCLCTASSLSSVLTSQAAVVVPTELQFETELLSLSLTGGPVPLPLASDPGNALGDSIEGYGFVLSSVTVTLSSSRLQPGPASTGMAFATNGGLGASQGDAVGPPQPINPDLLDGQQFFVDSFFDVFFDITITDVDARSGRDYAGMPDGTSLTIPDNGPAHMEVQYFVVFDKEAPNFGLIPPPEASPYVGHLNIEIPLGGDINGNGEDDKIKFTLATHTVENENRTFIILPDGTVLDTFDSTATLEGLVVDESTDPPFGPFTLTGPTTASSNLLNPLQEPVPEPSSFAIGAFMACCAWAGRWMYRRKRIGSRN